MDRTKSTDHISYKKNQQEAVSQGHMERTKERQGQREKQTESYAAVTKPEIHLILHQSCSDHPGYYTCKL